MSHNPIIALLQGPDNQYKSLLIQDNDVLKINSQCRDKNSFLQIHVRALNAKEQKRLLKKQYHQLSKQYRQSIKKQDRCLHFTFPITYPCPPKSKRTQSSIISNSSQTSNQISNKSSVSIPFINDKTADMSIYKIPKENPSSSLLNIPSKNHFTNKIHSSNACIEKHLCQLCGSILSNGICSCIVQYLLKLNDTNENDILVEFNEIFKNLTSNNIIT